jgi:hypothetical protein
MSRSIVVPKWGGTIDNKKMVEYIEVWEVPEDFSKAEENLLREMCSNNVLSVAEAKAAVRELR